MDIKDLVQQSLDKMEEERNAAKQHKERIVYNVQYVPCGHFREIDPSETDLMNSALLHAEIYLDAFTLSSAVCPICIEANHVDKPQYGCVL